MMIAVQGATNGPSVGQLLVIMLGSLPIVGIMGWAAVKILGPIAQAFGRRVGGGSDAAHLEQRLETLALELDQVRAQLAETHERLDFTERLLSQGRGSEQLPKR